MNLCVVLKLMTLPTILGSLLALAIDIERVSAVDSSNAVISTSGSAACDSSAEGELKSSSIQHIGQGIHVASTRLSSGETGTLNFSEAESDAAAVLFGCDCPNCISALRQLQNQSLFNNPNGHCLTSLQRRVSPQRMQEVLQDLKMREAEQVY
jgi:hypothetical protein